MAERDTGKWARESLAIVRALVYRLPASGEITASYTKAAHAVIRTGLAQSGIKAGVVAK
jgi:signal transduction histidine kinase